MTTFYADGEDCSTESTGVGATFKFSLYDGAGSDLDFIKVEVTSLSSGLAPDFNVGEIEGFGFTLPDGLTISGSWAPDNWEEQDPYQLKGGFCGGSPTVSIGMDWDQAGLGGEKGIEAGTSETFYFLVNEELNSYLATDFTEGLILVRMQQVGAASVLADQRALSEKFGNCCQGQPVPEPSTYALIAGILSLGFVAWRRYRR